MRDISDFPSVMQDAMRTGKMPSREALARASGKTVEEIADALSEDSIDEGEPESQPEDPEAQAFRDKYHRLVAEMKAAWLEENFTFDNRVPAAELERIEDTCNRQVQHEWRRHQQRNTSSPDDDE